MTTPTPPSETPAAPLHVPGEHTVHATPSTAPAATPTVAPTGLSAATSPATAPVVATTPVVASESPTVTAHVANPAHQPLVGATHVAPAVNAKPATVVPAAKVATAPTVVPAVKSTAVPPVIGAKPALPKPTVKPVRPAYLVKNTSAASAAARHVAVPPPVLSPSIAFVKKLATAQLSGWNLITVISTPTKATLTQTITVSVVNPSTNQSFVSATTNFTPATPISSSPGLASLWESLALQVLGQIK